jgi:BirA family transcriptional regulator, biotin operon repressor / biotin---[acetyl-CoA-carboxylase] ligase
MKTNHLHFPCIESTNLYAKRHHKDFDPEALTVISADEQTRGRGREGRSWDSPKNANCTITFCSFAPKSFPHLQNFGQVLSLACIDLLKSLDIPCRIKWPNDILIEGKKAAGILCDIITSRSHTFIANGIGLNVNMTEEQLSYIPTKAASLACVAGKEFDIGQIRQRLTEIYRQYLSTFLKEGFSPFIERYRGSVPYRPDQKISFHSREEITQGFFHSLADDGSLNLSLSDNKVKNFVNIETI